MANQPDRYFAEVDNPSPGGEYPIRWEVTSEVRELEAERDRYRAALAELVILKGIKDALGKTDDYERRQPAAWEAARALLADKPC